MRNVLFLAIGAFIGCIIISLHGCGAANHLKAYTLSYSRMCIDGVKYYQFTSGAAVAYDKEGKIKTC